MQILEWASKYIGRKFLGVVFLIVAAMEGWIEDDTKFLYITIAAVAYFLSEGAVDIVKYLKTGTDVDEIQPEIDKPEVIKPEVAVKPAKKK